MNQPKLSHKLIEESESNINIPRITILLCVSATMHVMDVATDVSLAYGYYIRKQFHYFIMTALFVLLSALTTALMSYRFYNVKKENATFRIRIFRFVVLIFQLDMIFRSLQVLQYARKYKKALQNKNTSKIRKYYDLMMVDDSYVAFLRIMEGFLEAAPQTVLQIAIVLRDVNEGRSSHILGSYHQVVAICISVMSMASSMAVYNRAVRFVRKDKRKLNARSAIILFSWIFLLTASRIISLSGVASIFPLWMIICCVIHWNAMSLWLAANEKIYFCLDQNFTTNTQRIGNFFVIYILGFAYIFAYITLQDGSTRWKYITYYSLCFLENTTAAYFWYNFSETPIAESYILQLLFPLTFLPFLLGIILMLVYYQYFHPNILAKNLPEVLLSDNAVTLSVPDKESDLKV